MCEYRTLCENEARVLVVYTGDEPYEVGACDECVLRIPTRDAYGKPNSVHISDHAYYVQWLADKVKAIEWLAREEKTKRMYEEMIPQHVLDTEARAAWAEAQYVDMAEREDV